MLESFSCSKLNRLETEHKLYFRGSNFSSFRVVFEETKKN